MNNPTSISAQITLALENKSSSETPKSYEIFSPHPGGVDVKSAASFAASLSDAEFAEAQLLINALQDAFTAELSFRSRVPPGKMEELRSSLKQGILTRPDAIRKMRALTGFNLREAAIALGLNIHS